MDGEGSFFLSNSSSHYKGKTYAHKKGTVKFAVIHTPTNMALMKEIQRFFAAGHIYFRPKRYFVGKGYSGSNPHAQIEWRVQAKIDVLRICYALQPYLKIKRVKCDILIHYLKNTYIVPKGSIVVKR